MEGNLFVEVVLPLALPKLYTYSVPLEYSEQMAVGKRVAVPFGRKKVYAAIVCNVHSTAPSDYATKDIFSVIDSEPIVTPEQFALWTWMAEYYMCSLGEVMKAALPAGLKMESETIITATDSILFDSLDLNTDEAFLFETIKNKEGWTVEKLATTSGVKNPMGVIKTMLEKGYLSVHESLEATIKPKLEQFVRLHPRLKTDDDLNLAIDNLGRAEAQQRLLMAFLSITVSNASTFSGWVKRKDLVAKANVSPSALMALLEKQIFEIEDREVSRLLRNSDDLQDESPLSEAQKESFNSVNEQFAEKSVVLLHGVTSSGKTEIYIKLISEQLERGKQVLYILPEIALTAQIINRLKKFFGNRVGVYHSKYSDGQRVEIYNGLLTDGKDAAKVSYDVVIGVRSSIFLPFRRLGLVIIDEEHENTLKQMTPSPRYHARDSAIVLASKFDAKVLLGTATPAIETFYNAQIGKYGLVTLNERFGGVELPEILVVDTLTARKKKLMKTIFSPQLLTAIEQTLEKGEQAILFQNRRGYAPFVECDECAWIPQCKHCAVTLTYHKKSNQLVCHYCGYALEPITRCLACGSTRVSTKGFGTEKVEDELGIYFPNARVDRLDVDTARSRASYERIISEFEEGQIDILVGTQMVSKGLDFDKVSLVGILNADNMLNFPDFRAYERSFQLMTQVSGRAGRRGVKGRVIIQTSHPDHPVIHQTVISDYLSLFKQQLIERQQYTYPPYCRIIKLSLKHRKPELLDIAANGLVKNLKVHLGSRVLGPEEPLINRVQDLFIRDIIIKLERNVALQQAKAFIAREIERVKEYKPFASIQLSIDVDPM